MGRRRFRALSTSITWVLLAGFVLLGAQAAASTTCESIARLKGTVVGMTIHTMERKLEPDAERFERLTHVTFLSNRSTVTIADDHPKIGTTVCTFDRKNRLVKAETQSGPGGLDGYDEDVTTYKYVGRTTIARMKTIQRVGLLQPHHSESTTYVTRDVNGRIISEAVHYGPELWQRDSTTYTYFANRVEARYECGELDALCWDDIVLDLDGNEISRKGTITSTSGHEFDAVGNWTKRLKRWTLHEGPMQDGPFETIETREITYR